MIVSAKGARFSPMALAPFSQTLREWRPGTATQLALGLGAAFALALALVGPDRLIAQIEGDRGIAPIASSTDIQVGGIEVVTTGKTPEEARVAGWKEAQRKGWEMLKGPQMSDAQIDAMVSAVVIEHEQIGPHRYVATLGVIFDRARAGQYVGGGSDGTAGQRSAPMLVIPVLESGGTSQVFEVRGAWQKAWANFRTAASPIDYVRPAGSGGESLILNAGQPGRRSRTWWRNVLDQFGAADVLIPVARLERQWPGGPVTGTFTARYGPDNTFLDSFTLTAPDEAGVPAMLNQALVRLDRIYADGLSRGLLRPDPTLIAQQQQLDAALAALTSALAPKQDATETGDAPTVSVPSATPSAAAQASIATFTVQFASPDAAAVDATLNSVRAAAGVRGASTSSIAIGGTSVMRVTVDGDINNLAAALRARGFSVTTGNNALSIRR
jgi:hypothetical protein